jgi:hypothetical protein
MGRVDWDLKDRDPTVIYVKISSRNQQAAQGRDQDLNLLV